MPNPSPELSIPAAVILNYPMSHNEEQVIDIHSKPLSPSELTYQEIGITAPTVAKVDAGGHNFSVLDVSRHAEFATPLLVVDKSYDSKQPHCGYKGIWAGVPLTIGRNHHNERFNYLPGVSREHFSIAFNGLALVIRNHAPTNPTLLSGELQGVASENPLDNVIADFTYRVEDDMRERHDFGPQDKEAPYGYYKNHPIIGRQSTSVKNGVYFTSNPDSEAVVVDDKSRALQQLKRELLAEFVAQYGERPTLSVIKALERVNKFTRNIMPYSDRKADRLSKPLYEGNKLIGLSEYVREKGGVCRHQCLVAAFLAESLVEEGLLLGQVGVERNHDIDAHGAHAWAVFKSLDGTSVVIDPAQNFVGTKQQAQKERRWKYALPADR